MELHRLSTEVSIFLSWVVCCFSSWHIIYLTLAVFLMSCLNLISSPGRYQNLVILERDILTTLVCFTFLLDLISPWNFYGWCVGSRFWINFYNLFTQGFTVYDPFACYLGLLVFLYFSLPQLQFELSVFLVICPATFHFFFKLWWKRKFFLFEITWSASTLW